MTPEAKFFVEQARECLNRGRVILAAGVGEDAGRNAYLAVFHVAQALVFERTSKVAKTHRGIQTLVFGFTRDEPELQEFSRFLSESYNLKQTADYPIGPDAHVSRDEAEAAIVKAERFVDHVAALLA